MVSVLVAVYNTEKYLRRCLDSIVNQIYGELQVVIVDDGSTDNSLSICEEYSERYEAVEVYHQENAGVAATRNMLLDKAQGDYTIFIDSDDWIEPNMIEDLLHYINQYDLDIAICGSVREDGNTVVAVDTTFCEPLIEGRENTIRKFLIHKDINGSLWNKLIKTSLFQNLRFANDIWYGEDALMMWQILQRVERIGTVPTSYYHYRMNDESISHQTFGPKKISGHKVWEIICADTCRDWPQYKRIAKSAFAIADMWLLYYAALDKYPLDSNIRQFQLNVRRHIADIIRTKYLKINKKLFAIGMSIHYKLGSFLIRKYT